MAKVTISGMELELHPADFRRQPKNGFLAYGMKIWIMDQLFGDWLPQKRTRGLDMSMSQYLKTHEGQRWFKETLAKYYRGEINV